MCAYNTYTFNFKKTYRKYIILYVTFWGPLKLNIALQ